MKAALLTNLRYLRDDFLKPLNALALTGVITGIVAGAIIMGSFYLALYANPFISWPHP